MTVCNYKDDKKQGEYIEFYDNGNIKIKCNYNNDKKTWVL